jgi:hypothetical protein
MAENSAFNIDLRGLKALAAGLNSLPEKIPSVTSRSINHAVDRMYTEAWKVVKPEYFTKMKYFSRATKKIRANPSNLKGGLVATGKNLFLSSFKFSPSKPFAGGRAGGAVSVQIGPGVSAKLPTSDPRAFVARMPSGFIGVFARRGKKRYPFAKLRSDVSAASMLAGETVRKKLEEIGKNEFDKEFRRLTDLEMKKAFGNLPR